MNYLSHKWGKRQVIAKFALTTCLQDSNNKNTNKLNNNNTNDCIILYYVYLFRHLLLIYLDVYFCKCMHKILKAVYKNKNQQNKRSCDMVGMQLHTSLNLFLV